MTDDEKINYIAMNLETCESRLLHSLDKKEYEGLQAFIEEKEVDGKVKSIKITHQLIQSSTR